ncbi:metallophosphoesterase family protein [Sulfuriroseicoccus oceanibius]|uniref:DNA repair exonuclease n=1 Tax=Sulfuriroseicoccus oceanibius TaxID=2707525 RepID=A0A6B3L3C5_9BACT|nr:DNA repair exonuclease [Sulfuriroseicoccus oceanibius]QQL44113.1 DNA repair exonuclease [Sulfuriroseicoccus oceanibius]
MSLTFLHTADWQIGKPFQSIASTEKREHLRRQRIDTVASLKDLVDQHGASFVVVAGDLFDSFTPDKSTVSAFCKAVGKLGVPVIAIPGNHDHGGPGTIWTQPFFLKERDALAPNFKVLLKPEPYILEDAVILPCPLLHRHNAGDSTAWLHVEQDDLPSDRPRIVLAHGSTQGFSSNADDDTTDVTNQMELSRIAGANYDYIALGDWHGTKQITPQAWYSGTPEQDRHAKGGDNQPGNALVVTLDESPPPAVQVESTGRMGWHELSMELPNDAALDHLKRELEAILENDSANHLLKLNLSGTLSLTGANDLEALVESLESRLIDLRLTREFTVEPSADELAALVEREDPLIAGVAQSLHGLASNPDHPEHEVAKRALRELHIQLQAVSH